MRGKGKIKSEPKVKTEIQFEMPSKLPEFPIADVNNCPVYVSGVKKGSRGVALKDIVSLQYELEYMHLCTLRRHETLKTEISCFENPAAKKNKRSRSSDSIGKKCAKKSKKCKGSGNKSSTPHRSKNKFIQPPPRSFDCGVTDAQVEMPRPQKNDGPSRFWAFIEPYCADITDDDIKILEEWIKTHDEDTEYQEIPELGSHFAEQWPKDDMEEEAREGSKSIENQKGSLDSDAISTDKERILKMGELECKQSELRNNSQQRNSLAQRLVSSLVQENVMTSLDVSLAESSKDDNLPNTKPKASSSKQNSTKRETFENKLARSLSEIGAMEKPDYQEFEDEDEILAELKRLQKALIPVSERNLAQKKALLATAKAEMKKQDVKKKLKEIDAKVMESYRAIHAAKCENKPPPKKIILQIGKTLNERKKVIEQLNNM